MSRTACVTRTDDRDTLQKRALIRDIAANNPVIAVQMAQAISADDSMLHGLAPVVALLARHEKARDILEPVFNRPGNAKKYAKAFQAFSRVKLEQLFGPAVAVLP